MTKNNEEMTINFLFDCKKCKLKSEEECLIYERCYKANEYICNLNKNLKAKEQEHKETQKALAKCWIDNGRLKQECEELTSKCSQLKQTLAEIKKLVEKEFCRHIECCEFCANSNDCLNRKIIEKINEVEDADKT